MWQCYFVYTISLHILNPSRSALLLRKYASLLLFYYENTHLFFSFIFRWFDCKFFIGSIISRCSIQREVVCGLPDLSSAGTLSSAGVTYLQTSLFDNFIHSLQFVISCRADGCWCTFDLGFYSINWTTFLNSGLVA